MSDKNNLNEPGQQESNDQRESQHNDLRIPPRRDLDPQQQPPAPSTNVPPRVGRPEVRTQLSSRFSWRVPARIRVRILIVAIGTAAGLTMRFTLPAEWRGQEPLPRIITPAEQVDEATVE